MHRLWEDPMGRKNQAAIVEDAYRAGLQRGAALRNHLGMGGQPNTFDVFDVMLEPDETPLMDVPLQYGRWYGTDATYIHNSTLAMGRPSFVAATMIGSAIGNASRRSAAWAAAQPQWRENQVVRTLVTNQRIMCWTQAQGWLSFWFRGVTAVYPEPANSTVTLEFSDSEPLRLQGYDGSSLCVFTLAILHGRKALYSHPALVDAWGY